MTDYQSKKYQSFEKIPNRWGGFTKLYSGIYTHHCIHNAAKKNRAKRIELIKYFLSETAFSRRQVKIKNANFTLNKGYAIISTACIKKKLDINRGITTAFLNDLERDSTVSLRAIKGVGYLIKFHNFEKYQKAEIRLKVSSDTFYSFNDDIVKNLMPINTNNATNKTSLKETPNKLVYNNKELKELKDKKESIVSNYPAYNMKLNTLCFLQEFYNSLTQKLKIKVEPFLKISQEGKQEVNNLIEKLEEMGFSKKTLSLYQDTILELFSSVNFRGKFVNFYLFIIKLTEWFDELSNKLAEKEALELERKKVDDIIKNNIKPITEKQKNFTEAFYKELQKTMQGSSFDKFLKDKVLITPVSAGEDYYYIKVLYADESTKAVAYYHYDKHINKAFNNLKMNCVSSCVFTDTSTAIITNFINH